MERMTPSWHAERTPDVLALVMGGTGETVTYAELDDRSRRLARALRERGVAVGDHIAILRGNNRPFLKVAWAAQRSGLHCTAITGAAVRPTADPRTLPGSWRGTRRAAGRYPVPLRTVDRLPHVVPPRALERRPGSGRMSRGSRRR